MTETTHVGGACDGCRGEGPVEPRVLQELAHHDDAALPPGAAGRLNWLSDDLMKGCGVFITSRQFVDLRQVVTDDVVDAHRHEVPQIFLVIGEPQALEIRVSIEAKEWVIESPAAVVIPARALHRLEVLRGSGLLVSILLSGNYA